MGDISFSFLNISADVNVSNSAATGYLDLQSMITNKCWPEVKGPFKSIANVSHGCFGISDILMVEILHVVLVDDSMLSTTFSRISSDCRELGGFN